MKDKVLFYLDQDAALILKKLLVAYNTFDVSKAIVLAFKEINKITSPDSLVHTDSIINVEDFLSEQLY